MPTFAVLTPHDSEKVCFLYLLTGFLLCFLLVDVTTLNIHNVTASAEVNVTALGIQL